MKILYQRISVMANSILNSYQSGLSNTIPICEILVNIKEFLRIQEVSNIDDVGLVSPDCMSAFDELNHEYLLEILKIMGFPYEFIMLYNNILKNRNLKIFVNN